MRRSRWGVAGLGCRAGHPLDPERAGCYAMAMVGSVQTGLVGRGRPRALGCAREGAKSRCLRVFSLLILIIGFWGRALAQVNLPQEMGEIVVVGDELAAGYGLPAHEMFPAVLLRELRRDNLRYQLRSASGPGDTAEVGARRAPVVLQVPGLKWVVLALGRNDAAKQEPLDVTRRGLTAAIEAFLEKGVSVLLCGFQQAPTDDLAYAAGFTSLFPELARAYRLPFVTNVLANVEGVPAMNLSDGKHPNKEGQKQIARNILDVLQPILKAAQTNQVPATATPPRREVPEGTVAPQIQF